ncbi:SET and MYND domain-containing protein [Trypanosoma rangeli]|uniref:SET and MYND domain-containing protein n=1 Tax=Trypanosoma rangeli TaxID=5698 RepID=A0A422N693_TRYRA|nr:SET and MYND domain-containing protein [Trypanosoma rangeli]RNF00961.1 SET and MYND domain-containing protein [Trypanosoma rangeli]|eukprot:RNF00961.1 SET and MYND domain-containing protein [Trypanosoma rangeli]
MKTALPPEVAAQAQARRELAANLGALQKPLLELARMLPPGSGARPMEEVLTYLRNEDAPRLANLVERLKQEVQGGGDVNNDEAERWKEQGVKAYEMGKMDESVLMYTRGVMYASQDETLATLLYDRSTVFLAQARLTEALADAHMAFTLMPNNWKALERRGVCLQKLGFEEEGKKDIHAADIVNAASANTVKVISKIIHVDGGSCEDKAMNLLEGGISSSHVDSITYNDNMRGVVAKCRLELGEIMTEMPVVHALHDDHWCIRCSYCLRMTQALYPGTAYREKEKLARGLFCGEECGRLSWERFGQYESANPFFQICPIEALVASRILCSEDAVFRCKSIRGNFTGELYPVAIVGGYETAVSLCALLLDAVGVKDADRLRFAQRQVLLSSFDIKFYTGSQITIHPETREALIGEPRPIPVGKAMYVSAAQYRHSCDPNCFASFVGNPLGCSPHLVIRVIRPVHAGEELTIAYHNMTTYKAVSAQFRRRVLAERCGFMCNCKACLENKDERVTIEKKGYYIQASDLYQKGCRLIREGQYDVAVTVLSQSYAIVMEQLCPPPRPPQSMIPKTHMALARAFNNLKDNKKCVEHLLAKMELDLKLYGEVHLEFIDDYIRLAYLAPTEEERGEFAQRAKTLLSRFYAPSKELLAQMSRLDSFVARPGL